jgi:hypothetical protein
LVLEGPVVEVASQQAHQGAFYDDIVVTIISPNTSELQLECQVRVAPRLATSRDGSSDLDELVAVGIRALQGAPEAFSTGTRRLGLICSRDTRNSDALERIARVAGMNAETDDYVTDLSTPGRFNERDRSMWRHVREGVLRATGEENISLAFAYLKHLTVIRWDAEDDADFGGLRGTPESM